MTSHLRIMAFTQLTIRNRLSGLSSKPSTRKIMLKSINPDCMVEFFDSFTKKNRIEPGRIIQRRTSSIVVEIERPVRKRVIVPSEYVRLILD